jgi:hypothetical protein
MALRLFAVAGVLFMALGVVGFVHPEIRLPGSTREMNVGSKTFSIETHRVYLISRSVSGLLLVGGAMMIFFSTRRG